MLQSLYPIAFHCTFGIPEFPHFSIQIPESTYFSPIFPNTSISSISPRHQHNDVCMANFAFVEQIVLKPTT